MVAVARLTMNPGGMYYGVLDACRLREIRRCQDLVYPCVTNPVASIRAVSGDIARRHGWMGSQHTYGVLRGTAYTAAPRVSGAKGVYKPDTGDIGQQPIIFNGQTRDRS
jgi:hypothetical protein